MMIVRNKRLVAAICGLTLLVAANSSLALFGDGDVTGVGDVSGDAVSDVALFAISNGPSGVPVDYMSGTTGKRLKSVHYLDAEWYGIAMATVADSNADGVANDPAVAVLGVNFSAGTAKVQVRRAADGDKVDDDITFLDRQFVALDVAVLDDTNGDGAPNDPSLAVLGVRPDTWRTVVEVRRLHDGRLVGRHTFLTAAFFQGTCFDPVFGSFACQSPVWLPVAVAALSRPGASPLLGVLAWNQSTGKSVIEARRLSNGALHQKLNVFAPGWLGLDLTVLNDVNGDGVQDDPAYVVLARHRGTQQSALELRRVSNGRKLKRLGFLDTWWVFRALTVADVSGGTSAGLGVMAQNPADGTLMLQIKHADSGVIARDYTPRAVFINNKRLTERDLRRIEAQLGVRLSTGNFWYDSRSGLWGFTGGPALGIIAAHLALGGRSLPQDASHGNTSVFLNGRELHQLEVAFLRQVFGRVPPGRYYLEADGSGGLEGSPPSFNLWLAAGGQDAIANATQEWAGSSVLGASGEFDTQGNWSVYSSYVGGVGGTPDGCIYTTFSDWAPPGC